MEDLDKAREEIRRESESQMFQIARCFNGVSAVFILIAVLSLITSAIEGAIIEGLPHPLAWATVFMNLFIFKYFGTRRYVDEKLLSIAMFVQFMMMLLGLLVLHWGVPAILMRWVESGEPAFLYWYILLISLIMFSIVIMLLGTFLGKTLARKIYRWIESSASLDPSLGSSGIYSVQHNMPTELMPGCVWALASFVPSYNWYVQYLATIEDPVWAEIFTRYLDSLRFITLVLIILLLFLFVFWYKDWHPISREFACVALVFTALTLLIVTLGTFNTVEFMRQFVSTLELEDFYSLMPLIVVITVVFAVILSHNLSELRSILSRNESKD